MRRIACSLLLSVLGCNVPAGPAGFSAGTGGIPAPTTTEAGSSGESSSGEGSSTSSTSSSTGAEDASAGESSGTPPDLGPPGPTGCLGKIDFLFVISSFGSMFNQQKQLIESLPGFYSAIEANFPDFDAHILVTDTDKYWHWSTCDFCVDDCDPAGVPPECGVELDACDTTMGAGLTFPAGEDASGRRCDLAGGRRYITPEQADPLAAFLCLGQVGLSGSAPHPAEAMVKAISPELTGPGGCNEGFLRDDALLVVTIIADIFDEESKGFDDYWIDQLMAAKHGDPDAFVVLVVTSDKDVQPSLCGYEYTAVKNRLRELVEAAPHGRIGSVCAESYVPFFTESMSMIAELCDGFIPR